VTVPAPLSGIPFFVRAGAVVPTRQVVQHVGEAPIDPLTFTVYPGELQSASDYYEDDGLSFDYRQGKFFRRTVTQWNAEAGMTVVLGAAKGSWVPPQRDVLVRVLDVRREPGAVELDGNAVKKEDGPGARGSALWWYDTGERTVTVRLPESLKERRIRILNN
jgi:hypothetical protein